jgi:hypothetical protein
MSSPLPTDESPRVPWPFLIGVFILLVGFFLSFFGGFFFNGGHERLPPQNKIPALALVVLRVAFFAFGSYLLAVMDQVRGKDLSLVMVLFIFTPLPAISALAFNYLGNYLRRTGSTGVQVILIGAAIFALALSGGWAWDLHRSGVVRASLQAFAWPILLDLGVACALLAAVPSLAQSRSSSTPDLEPDQAHT